MQKPLLSIGMIFKNEIRCLERCLKSLEPLRHAIPCELVMADTGSDDGSREIAGKYADVLIDFPWINNFSAARNAVMDRCSGVWYLSIDADEWLDKNIEELVSFLKADLPFEWASLHIFNYDSPELENGGAYADFIAIRMARMSTGVRFEGVIHERWNLEDHSHVTRLLSKTILHHDGYLFSNQAQALAKARRNMELLQIQLEQDPENLITLLQCAECAEKEESLRYVQQALDANGPERKEWPNIGPPLLRKAVREAYAANLPELETWIARAEEEFPDSIFIRVDVACCAFSLYLSRKNDEAAIHYGEKYLQAVKDYETGRFDRRELQYSALHLISPPWVRRLKIYLADVYQQTGQTERAVNLLNTLDGSEMSVVQIEEFVKALRYLHSRSNFNTAPLIQRFWDQIGRSGTVTGLHEERKKAFMCTGSQVFVPSYRADENQQNDFCRPAYTLFLPLAGQCELGTAAAILGTEDRPEIEKLLGTVESWDRFPVYALEHALLEGARFPIPGKLMKIEEMDGLAARMARPDGSLTGLAVLTADEELSDWQSLAWARGLVLAAVKSCDWESAEQGMELSRAFAKIESAFLPKYYTADLLCDENIQLLPPMHRFGWYCGRAFWALDAGDSTTYVRLLRQGLETCPEMKGMVEFLLRQLEESRKVQATPELLALAEQVRIILAQYPADDPAVEALKQSAAYQKVKHLIEGPDPGIYGGLKQ